MAMIKANPIRSVGINTVPKTMTLETVAESGSIVPMRLADVPEKPLNVPPNNAASTPSTIWRETVLLFASRRSTRERVQSGTGGYTHGQ